MMNKKNGLFSFYFCQPDKGKDKESKKDLDNEKATDEVSESAPEEKVITEEEEQKRAEIIEKLPQMHIRGLMSTLINLNGEEALNRQLDPLPPPRPMPRKLKQ